MALRETPEQETTENSKVAGSPRPTLVTPFSDPLNRANLGLLPEPKGRVGSFSVAVVANVLFVGILVLLTMAQVHKEALLKYQQTQLVFPADVPKPPPPVLPRIKIVAPPPTVAPKIELPRQIQLPKPQPEPPRPQTVHLTPVMPDVPAARPKAVVTPPQPRVGTFVSNNPTPVANNKSAPTTKTGGFGNPSGAVANPNATTASNVPVVGSFGAAPGSAQGAGAARAGSVHGTSFGSGVVNGVAGGTSRGAVASAGFGSGAVGGTGTGRQGRAVASTGFGNTAIGAPAAPSVKTQEPTVVGVVLLWKPEPQYTAEAKQLRIEGQVTLQVRFAATGHVEVLRVVSGLGHGLDEEAKRAAMQIRFKPALKNGQPVDQISNVNITFQLA